MPRRIGAAQIIAVLGTTASLLCEGAAPADAQRLEPGGSNYIVYYIIPAYIQGCQCPPYIETNPVWLAWARLPYIKGGFEHVVGDYHHHPEIVKAQLREMYAGGQRKIGVILHLLWKTSECMDLSSPPPDVCHTTHAYDDEDGSWGFAIPLDTINNGLLPQTLQNLKHLLADLRQIGFNQINIRFAPFGELEARGWRNGAEAPWNYYHEILYQKYWIAVRGAIDSVNIWVPRNDPFQVFYDLAAEAATYMRQIDGKVWNAQYSFGHFPEFARRLWHDYLARYGNTRTVGFTFGNRILYPGATGWEREVITVMNREVYDRVGERPKFYAFDIYPNGPGERTGLNKCKHPCYDKFFEEVARQLRSDSTRPPAQLLVWEGLYQDKKFADAVKKANQKLKLGIPYVMQWPTLERPWGGHLTVPFPRDFDIYARLSR